MGKALFNSRLQPIRGHLIEFSKCPRIRHLLDVFKWY